MYILRFIDNNILLTATGAWFTDSFTYDNFDDPAEITLGQIVLETSDNSIDVTAEQGCNLAHFLPGCGFTISGLTISTAAGTEPMYVTYNYGVMVVAVYGQGENDRVNMNALYDEVNGAKILQYNEGSEGLYYRTAGQTIVIPQQVLTLTENTGNIAYDALGTRYVLNHSSDYVAQQGDVDLSDATINVVVMVDVAAIQAHEFCDFDWTTLNQVESGTAWTTAINGYDRLVEWAVDNGLTQGEDEYFPETLGNKGSRNNVVYNSTTGKITHEISQS